MKQIYKLITLILLIAYSSSAISQTQTAESWVLDSLETGNKTYIARESIVLNPGFSYSASAGNTFNAKIDRTLVFPPTGNTYLKPDGTFTADPTQGAVAGSIQGQFDVSPTGAATYSVPIEVPPGIQGMQPNISLVYNSQSGNGIAGMCWNIGGLSMISRVPKDFYFDYERTGIIWDNTSPLALDGQRLIIANDRWGNDSIEYRTESGLDRIVGYNIKSWGPLTFKVYTKEGKILEYGNKVDVNSYFPIRLATTANIETSTTVRHLGWALSRITDTNNNFTEFAFTADVTNSSGYSNYKNVCISSISYGNQTGTTKETAGKVNFTYTERTNPTISYIDSMEMSNKYILDNIQIKGMNDLLLETYALTYSTLDQKDFLTQIKRTNTSGEYIQPVKFDWHPMSYSYNYNKTLTFHPTPDFSSYLNFVPYSYGDIDGDGLIDILVRTSTSLTGGTNSWIVYRNLGNNVFQKMYEENWDKDNESTFLFLDLDNDGKDELYVGRVKQSGAIYTYYLNCYKYVNNSFQSFASGDKSVVTSKSVYDKRNSLYALSGDFLGSGTSQFIIFSSKNTPEFSMGFPGYTTFPFGNSSNSKIFLTDLNGNGKSEIAFVNDETTTFYEYQNYRFVNILSTKQFKYNDYIQVGDFNGDGNSDLLVLNKYAPKKWKIFTSNGKSFIEKNMSSFISSDVSYNKALVVDVNGDGKSDILTETSNWVGTIANTATLRIISSTGDSFSTQVLDTQANITPGIFQSVSQFKSGHSKDVFVSFNKSPQIMSLSPNIWFNKINKITDSNGKQLTISYTDYKNPHSDYQNLSDTYDGGQSVLNVFLPNIEVVNLITATDLNQSYVFKNPKIDRQSKGFLGFATTQTIDNLRSDTTVAENKYNDSYHFIYPYKRTVKKAGGALISETYQTYTIIPGLFLYFLRQDSVISTDALKGITVKTTYSNYNTDRNPQTINTNYGNGISTTQALTYVSKGSRFQNKIASQQTTQKAAGQADVVRKEYFFYDNKGNPTCHVVDSTDINKVQTFYGNHDQYGNPQKITTTANGVSRSKSMTYCSFGRFLKTETNNQFNETTTYYYDESRGLLTSKINRLGTTSYEYDGFGRLKLTVYPDGIKTANALQWAGTISGKPTNAKYYSYSETSGQSPVWVWYDGLGREIRRDSYSLNNKKTMVDTEYNTKGQVYRVSDPYFENTSKTWAATYTYDSYGRNSYTVTPMGTTSYNYSGLTTTVTSPTGKRKTTTNSAGWTVEEETNGKKVNFTHYASGLVKTAIPADGQTLSMVYDLQGNRIKLTDPDAGVITSNYDGWGQLTQEKQKIHATADSIVTTYDYLASGLLNCQLRNGEKTNYGYDNLHRLNRVSIAGKHAQGFTYDQYDRIIQSNDTVDGSKVFISKTEYDLFGRVSKETYPSGYCISNQYDKSGYLTRIADENGLNIWQALESNAKGQLTKTKSGEKETVFGFNNKGFPTSIVTPGIANWSYLFDSKANLVSRTDGIANYKDSLAYDALNRLTSWKVYQGNTLQQTNSMSYDPLTGNIRTKSDLNNYVLSYGEDGQPPHALTSISGTPGIVPSADQMITYTDFKKVKQITEGDNDLNISYGTDEQRIKTVLGTLTRYYMGNYEEEIRNGVARKIHYITGGNGLAAIYVQNAGNDTLYFAHTDYQGSLTALSLPDGTVKERYAYDPWGNRRNPANWTQRDARTSFIFNRGYTLHEHLPEFNLINMNGRVYDPLTSMFFSPDPYLQSPGDWLNFNRYTYCLNNPFKYTDPSGEWIHIAIGAVVGGVINLGIKAYQGKINSWGDGFAAFGIGAAAGALGAATGGVAFAAAGGASGGVGGFLAGAAGGAAGTAFSSPVLAMGNTACFGDPMMTGQQYLFGIAGGTLLGGGINGITALANGRNFMTGNLPSSNAPIAPTVTQPVPNQQSNNTRAQQLEQNRINGRIAEDAAGINQTSKVRIDSPTGTAKYRIPDEVTSTTLREVKNVSYLDYTPQLQDFVKYSQQENLQMILQVRPANTIFGPATIPSPAMQNAIIQHNIIVEPIRFGPTFIIRF